MYSHLASNDTTGPLNFTDPNGWFRTTLITPVAGSWSTYGKQGSTPWIEIQTHAGPFRLNGVAWSVHNGVKPADTPSKIYLTVSANAYIEVAASDSVDSIFSHTHQSSFDNVYGNGTKPTVGTVLLGGVHPIDLLDTFAKQRIDGTTLNDTIVLNDMGSQANGNDGADRVTGGNGNDLMFGGKGNDTLAGVGAQDELHGDNANDRLYGGGDNDALFGGAGKDTAYGGDGQDAI